MKSDKRSNIAPRREPVEVEVRGFVVRLPEHPIYSFDASDPGTHLLAELVTVAPTDSVLVLGGGSGLLPVVAGRLAERGQVVVLADQTPEADQVEAAIRLDRAASVRVVRGSDSRVLGGSRFDVALLGTSFAASREALERSVREAASLLRIGGQLYLHGGKREGIESAAGLLREVLGNVTVLGYRKGHRVLLAERGELPQSSLGASAGSVALSLAGSTFEVEKRAGIFAGGDLDEGTRLLVESLAVRPRDEALDLGCGSGIVGLVLARRAVAGRVWLLDSDLGAVELARRNLARNGVENAEVLASDAYAAVGERRFDLIVTNPPFHVGHVRTTSIVERFVGEAPAHLRPGGRLYLVANQFLRYEPLFSSEAFESVEVVAKDSRYKVIRARIGRPRERRLRVQAAEGRLEVV